MTRRILVTAALPYANGDIHLGHMVEHCYTDFWVRYQRLRGNECRFICADDTHGTPIMLKARSEGITAEQLIEKMYERHVADFQKFSISHDYYSSTHTEDNRQIASFIYEKMRDQGYLENRTIKQYFCTHDNMFLPDRFVKGSCPRCKTPDQNGDSCDNCGATYEPIEVKSPYCSLCKNPPELRDTDHLYFKLNEFRNFIKEWVNEHTPKALHSKLGEWLNEDSLKDWCISRDAPYFGFEIPDRPGKFFYVWLDAPVGYISSTKKWCEATGNNFDDYWKNPGTEIYHVIGKDIVYFHALFWPAMLKLSGFTLPKEIFVHGFLTVNGAKMSKSKGTFIPAGVFARHIDPTYLRYYLACKLGPDIDDFDLSYDDFAGRVNSDLIGKITNIASRGAQMLQKKMDGKMSGMSVEGKKLHDTIVASKDKIADFYEHRQFAKVMVEVRELASLANKYFDELEPWKLIKTEPEQTKECLTTILNVFRTLCIYLKPILPQYVARAEILFGEEPYSWKDIGSVVENRELKPFTHLANRVDAKIFETIEKETIELYGVPEAPRKIAPAKSAKKMAQVLPEITIDDFLKIDLRVGLVVKSEEIAEAKKLLKLTVDIGEERNRTIFSGIKSAYDAESLVGRRVVVVANLQPRKMKFGLSEGMILATGPGEKEIYLLHPSDKTEPGERVN